MTDLLEGLKFFSTGLCAACPTCRSAWGIADEEEEDFAADIETQQALDEGGFSWAPCDRCNSALGGTRYAAHAIDKETGEIYHLDVCADCLE